MQDRVSKDQELDHEISEILEACQNEGYSFCIACGYGGFDISEDASLYIVNLIRKDLRNRNIID